MERTEREREIGHRQKESGEKKCERKRRGVKKDLKMLTTFRRDENELE